MKDKIKEKKYNIWFFHHYATPPTLTGLTRPYDFSKQLLKMGHKATVFASSYLHYSNEQLINNGDLYIKDNSSGVPFIYVRTHSAKGNGLNRVINMFDFAKNLYKVAKKEAKLNGKPDVIIASSPHPLTMIVGNYLGKKLNVPCICEVRDFWPEVFFYNGVTEEDSFLGKLLLRGEKWIYENASGLIFLKEGDFNYLLEHNLTKENGGKIDLSNVFYINNGIDLQKFKENLINNQLIDNDLDNNKFKVIYVGAIRPVNDVGFLVDTANKLKNENIEFLIFGDGNEKKELQNRVKLLNLDNIIFKGYVDKKFVPYILSKSSVNILNYSNKRYNWSRGNSSNKLFEYLASGKPVISTVKMGYSIIEKYKCGSEIENFDSKSLANEIMKYKKMDKEKYNSICENAKMSAQNFDFLLQTKNLLRAINATFDNYNMEGNN